MIALVLMVLGLEIALVVVINWMVIRSAIAMWSNGDG